MTLADLELTVAALRGLTRESQSAAGALASVDAEFVALTQLQADVSVTSDGDLARAVPALVQTATIGVLDAA